MGEVSYRDCYHFCILRFTAVNACFPPIKHVFRGVKRRFRVEDLVVRLRVCIFVPIFKDEVFYEVQGLRPIGLSLLQGLHPTTH